jgi:hypothetical protein
VFAAAAGVAVLAFVLSWLLAEAPLRKSVAAEGVAEHFATPREAESLPELERILATLAQRENRWRMYERFADQADVDLDPAELWLISRLGEGAAIDLGDARVASARESLRERGLLVDTRLADDGEIVYARVVEARRRGLAELLDGWEPERHDEVRAMLDRFARLHLAEPPAVSSRVSDVPST